MRGRGQILINFLIIISQKSFWKQFTEFYPHQLNLLYNVTVVSYFMMYCPILYIKMSLHLKPNSKTTSNMISCNTRWILEKKIVQYIFTELSIHPSICPSIHWSVYLSIHPFIDPSICPSIHWSIHLSVYPSIDPTIYPFLYHLQNTVYKRPLFSDKHNIPNSIDLSTKQNKRLAHYLLIYTQQHNNT